jgi:hypothetical protein
MGTGALFDAARAGDVAAQEKLARELRPDVTAATRATATLVDACHHDAEPRRYRPGRGARRPGTEETRGDEVARVRQGG